MSLIEKSYKKELWCLSHNSFYLTDKNFIYRFVHFVYQQFERPDAIFVVTHLRRTKKNMQRHHNLNHKKKVDKSSYCNLKNKILIFD